MEGDETLMWPMRIYREALIGLCYFDTELRYVLRAIAAAGLAGSNWDRFLPGASLN